MSRAASQVQSEGSEEEKNDRVLGELRHSDIDTLVCWRESHTHVYTHARLHTHTHTRTHAHTHTRTHALVLA